MWTFRITISLLVRCFLLLDAVQQPDQPQVHCAAASELISDGAASTDVQLVPVERGEKLVLQCRHCDTGHALGEGAEADDSVPRIWFEQRFVAGAPGVTPPREVRLGVSAPTAKNRVFTTPNHHLVIQAFDPELDGDLLECRGLPHADVLPVKYFLDDLKPSAAKEKFLSGGWEVFHDFENDRLTELSEAVQDAAGSDKPQVLMHWGPWSACRSCRLGTGKWWRRGRCRITAPSHLALLPFKLSTIACRSTLIDLMHLNPQFSQRLAEIPDFVMYNACECLEKSAQTIGKEKSVGDEFQRHLMEGDSVQILCPRSFNNLSLEIVEWTKGFDLLTAGEWIRLSKSSRLRVDILGSLLIEHADREAEGRYTCRSGSYAHNFFIVVQQRSVFTSPEFERSLLVVVVSILVCVLVYVSFVCMLCLERPQEGRRLASSRKTKRSFEEVEMQPWRQDGEDSPGEEEVYSTNDEYEGDGEEEAPCQKCLQMNR